MSAEYNPFVQRHTPDAEAASDLDASSASSLFPATPVYARKRKSSNIGKIALFVISLALMYHLFNGIRHLAQDAGHGFAIPDFVRSSWISIIGSAVLVVLVWGVVLLRWGQA